MDQQILPITKTLETMETQIQVLSELYSLEKNTGQKLSEEEQAHVQKVLTAIGSELTEILKAMDSKSPELRAQVLSIIEEMTQILQSLSSPSPKPVA